MVILTDALSVLQALGNVKIPSLSRQLHTLCQKRRMSLQWILAHCVVPGNEKADKLAKLGAKGDQPHHSVTHEEKVTVIITLTKPKPAKDDYHLLDRWKQVTIISYARDTTGSTPTCMRN